MINFGSAPVRLLFGIYIVIVVGATMFEGGFELQARASLSIAGKDLHVDGVYDAFQFLNLSGAAVICAL